MSNIVYADPFGSYIRGAEAGNQAALNTATTARQLQRADIENSFMKWYRPLREREAAASVGQSELGLNTGVLQNAARLTALGEPGQHYLGDVLEHQLPGYGFGGQTYNSPEDLNRRAREASGQGPSFYDPEFGLVGPHYAQKIFMYGGQGAPGTPGATPGNGAANAYSATGLPWMQQEAQPAPAQSSGGVQGTAPSFNYMNPNAYAPTPKPSIWADERDQSMQRKQGTP